MTRTRRVRLGLVVVGALLAMLVTIQPGHSQPYPPGPPGGGIRGGPPPGPVGPPGGGIRGGVGGMPGRPPGFPEPPPRPPGMGRRPGGGTTFEWSCSGCGRVLGTGPTPPMVRTCPGCGARLGGIEFAPPGPPAPGRPGMGPPPLTPPPLIPPPPPQVEPPVGRPGAFDNPPLVGAPPVMPPPPVHPGMGDPFPVDNNGVYVPPAQPKSSGSARSATLKVIGITMGVLLLLAVGIGAVVMVILKQQPVKKSRPRRRSPRYDDDDDY